jgi:hypothetical protein
MSKTDGEEASRDWKLLEALQVVDHEEVTKCVGEVRTMVVGLAQKWDDQSARAAYKPLC